MSLMIYAGLFRIFLLTHTGLFRVSLLTYAGLFHTSLLTYTGLFRISMSHATHLISMSHATHLISMSHATHLQLNMFLHAALFTQFGSVQFNCICSHTSPFFEPLGYILSNVQVSWCRSLSVTSVLRNAFSMCVTLSVCYSYLLSNAQVS